MSLFSKKTKQASAQGTGKLPFGLGHINYTWIVRHFAFLMFLALLAVIYIANGHWADNTIRDINVTAKQVKDMEYEYKNLKSIEMFRSRESQVTQAAAALGLKPPAEQPVKLQIKTAEEEH